jgi:hypothetical protein
MNRLAVCLGAALVLTGCAGYQTRFEVPPHLKTFSVATFTNRTLERNLDFEFTQALVKELHAKTPLRVASPDQADLIITGEIDARDRHLIRRQSRGLKSEVRNVLYVNVRMMDQKQDRAFFEGTRIQRRAEYRLNRGEDRRRAREELIRELARRVVALAFERWPNPHPPAPIVEGKLSAR